MSSGTLCSCIRMSLSIRDSILLFTFEYVLLSGIVTQIPNNYKEAILFVIIFLIYDNQSLPLFTFPIPLGFWGLRDIRFALLVRLRDIRVALIVR